MRNVIFRGLTDTEAPTWVYGCLVNNLWMYSENAKYPKGSAVCEIITGKYEGDCWEDIAEQENDAIITVIPESVGQFTGLLDKNGKEIYEGDVLRSVPTMKLDDTIIISRVEFDERRGMWVANAVKYDEKEYLFEAIKPAHETEVIGNIHQNPELLNQ